MKESLGRLVKKNMEQYTSDASVIEAMNRDAERKVRVVIERGTIRQDINILSFRSLSKFDQWVDSQPQTPNIVCLEVNLT